MTYYEYAKMRLSEYRQGIHRDEIRNASLRLVKAAFPGASPDGCEELLFLVNNGVLVLDELADDISYVFDEDGKWNTVPR